MIAAVIALLPLFVTDVYTLNILVLTLMFAALSQSWNILSSAIVDRSRSATPCTRSWRVCVHDPLTKFGIILDRHGGWRRAFRFHRPGARLSVLSVARALFHHCHSRDRGDRSISCSSIGTGSGAPLGIQIPIRRDSWLLFQFPRDKIPYFYFALALACAAWFVTWIFEDSKWGYWWRAVKDNPEAAESLGVVVFHSKMAAAAVSALFTSIAGSFYAQFVGYIDPESVMAFQFSLLMALPRPSSAESARCGDRRWGLSYSSPSMSCAFLPSADQGPVSISSSTVYSSS